MRHTVDQEPCCVLGGVTLPAGLRTTKRLSPACVFGTRKHSSEVRFSVWDWFPSRGVEVLKALYRSYRSVCILQYKEVIYLLY